MENCHDSSGLAAPANAVCRHNKMKAGKESPQFCTKEGMR